MPCRDDKYVLQEYYTYKLYNLVTPKSFKVRLVEVALDDPNLKAKRNCHFTVSCWKRKIKWQNAII
jgi:hypothetical protein